jgi:ribosome modulation factor
MNSIAYQEGYDAGVNPQQRFICTYRGTDKKDWDRGYKEGQRDYKTNN